MSPDYPAKPQRAGRRREKRAGTDAGEPREREPGRRLFVACDLPPDVLRAVERWQDESLRPHDELRVTGSLHVTLCFLGNVPERRVDDVAAALAGLSFPSLPTALHEPVFLPERGAKRVVALGLDDPSGGLRATQRSVSDALYRLGVYTPEKRPWLAHLTVARYRRPGQPFSLQNVTIEPFGLPSVILYASVLERGGAVHTPLATFPTVS
ncbi:MAG TPA: RNA 2',3'-cyclic phosphodiesterase [Thermoleophilia bacterium]|nr:RNA 2',3'-cyclic phosphodiesterase [Thermoleophilia bacterium]